MRVPLKFGKEISTGYDTVKVKMIVEDANGNRGIGWGESPLSPAWAWPSTESFAGRLEKMRVCCRNFCKLWKNFDFCGHPMEIGSAFLDSLPG
jgi:hypothetical protein